MPAPKGNQNAKGNKGGSGRPTKYLPAHPLRLAYNMALLGATNVDLARAFDVSETTIEAWCRERVEFSEALKAGRDQADAEVVKSLYRRALGYKHRAVKIFADPKTGAEKIVPYTEHYPPDTTAMIFWLKNRRPDLWRDRHEVTGKDGAPLVPDVTLRLVKADGGDTA